MLEDVYALCKLDDLVGVPGDVAGNVEPPVTGLDEGRVSGGLDTLVLQFTHVHEDGGTAGGTRNGGVKDLVGDALVVVRYLEACAVVEELAFETDLELVGGFGNDGLVAEGSAKLVVDVAGSGALAVSDGCTVDFRSKTHDTVGSTDLAVINPGREVEKLGEDDGAVHRRIPEGIVSGSQGGGLLVADGAFHECPVVPGEAEGRISGGLQEGRSGLAGIGLLLGSGEVEPVLDGEAAVGADGSVENGFLTCGVTDVDIEAELLGEGRVVVQESVAVDGLIGVLADIVVAAVAAVDDCGAVVFLLLDILCGPVSGDAALEGEALDNLP